jgi:BMFP domain-containing protein YqiC
MLILLGKVCGRLSTILGIFLVFIEPVKAIQENPTNPTLPIILAQVTLEKNSNKANFNTNFLEQIEQYNRGSSMTQLNNISQLRDVSPGDWAYEALQKLIEQYGCIAGYPNQMYRSQHPLSRYEFAAGLNTCLQQIEKLIAVRDTVTREDLDILLRLVREFQEQLAILRGRTDGLQARSGELEATQFSTNTKLEGEVIFALGSILAGDAEKNTVLGDRTRLELNTSFTGEDLLFTRLSTGNFPAFSEVTGTFEGDLAFAEPEDNDLGLETIFYTFPLSDSTEILLGATGTAADDLANTVNILDGDGATGAISRFGTRNPIYYPPVDAGLGIIHRFGEQIEISAGYLASPANEPSKGSGLFNGPYSALGQILFTSIENLNLALTYVHSYNQSDTKTGSNLANLQTFTEELFGEAVPTVSDSYGIQVSWAISDRLTIGGWGALSKVTSLSTLGGQLERGTQDVWNWALTLAFPDLGKEGNLAGIIVGMEPWVASSSIEALGDDGDTSLHLEAFYQYQVTDNFSLTPGIVWITAPDNDNSNGDLVIGTIRTTFSF